MSNITMNPPSVTNTPVKPDNDLHSLQVTYFYAQGCRNQLQKTQGKLEQPTWSAFKAEVTKPFNAPDKVAHPLFFAGTMEGNSRAAGNKSLSCTMVVLDYDGSYCFVDSELDDGGEGAPKGYTVAHFTEKLKDAGIESLVYTSPSHKPRYPKLRVVMPLSKAVTEEERAALAERVLPLFGLRMAKDEDEPSNPKIKGKKVRTKDLINWTKEAPPQEVEAWLKQDRERAAKAWDTVDKISIDDKKRWYFYGLNGQGESAQVSGAFIDLVKLPELFSEVVRDPFAELQRQLDAMNITLPVSQYDYEALYSPSEGVDRTSIELFNEHCSIPVLLEQQSYDYNPVKDKWLHPESGSGDHGLNVLEGNDGVMRAYSHNGTDPLYGQSWSAFDLYEKFNNWTFTETLQKAEEWLVEQGHMEQTAKAEAVIEGAPTDEKLKEAHTPRFTFSGGDSLFKPVPIHWLVRGVIERDSFAALYGASGSGKSFLAIDMALSIATGQAWHGHAVTAGQAVYVAGEGKAGLRRRVNAWTQKYGGYDKVRENFLLSDQVPLFPQAADDFIKALQGLPDLRLLVLDTLQRTFEGDENSTSDMTAFVQAVDKIRLSIPELVVMVVHHTGHSAKERARGSSVLRASLDAEMLMREEGAHRVVSCTKMKEAEPFSKMAFTLKSTRLEGWLGENGEGVYSAYIEHVENYAEPTNTSAKLGKNQREALITLKSMESEKKLNEKTGEKILIADWFDRCRHCTEINDSYKKPSKFLERIQNELINRGLIQTQNEYIWVKGE